MYGTDGTDGTDGMDGMVLYRDIGSRMGRPRGRIKEGGRLLRR